MATGRDAELQTLRRPCPTTQPHLLRRLPPHYQREQYERAFRRSRLTAIEQKKAVGADPTQGAAAAVRRADANVARKSDAREWDEQHGKLVDVSAFQRDILLIQGSRSAACNWRPGFPCAMCR